MPPNVTRKGRRNASALIFCIAACLPLMMILIFTLSRAGAADKRPESPRQWRIEAKRLQYDQTLQKYTATGNVTISKQGRTLTADKVFFTRNTGEAVAQGNVRMVSGKDILSGDRLKINLDSETGTLTDGTLFISKNHLYLSGRKIRKTGPHTYEAENVNITSCDGEDPDWKLTGRDFKVTIEGYGYAEHISLWAGKIPVIYSPFLFFPVKLQRQTGLLMPEVGYSDRKGTQYLQPFFWAIDNSSDATLYAHSMTARGLRAGLEYRYVLDQRSSGMFIADGFQDFRIDDGLADNSDRWGYEDDDVLRTNKDRYWIRMKHDHGYDSGVSAKLDIDVVSDQDYLQEFRTGYNGFHQTRENFQKAFGRNIDDYNDPVRLSRMNLNRTWSQYSLNMDLRWYDDVVKRRILNQDDTLQQLPALSLDGIKQPLGKSPAYFDIAGNYSHFYRIKGTRGHRVDVYPRLYYPLTLWQTLSVEPSAGLRQTAWQVDEYETRPAHGRNTLYRAVYDINLDLSTELFRMYNIHSARIDRLKHAVTPEIHYSYTPEQDQGDFPQFDAVDFIEPENLITYGFTNIFTARASNQTEQDRSAFTYTHFLRFKLSQSFDINKEREGDPEPFSAVSAELDLTPGRYIGLDLDAAWSPYDNQFETFNAYLNLWNQRGDSLRVDYRFTKDSGDTAQDGVQSLRLAGVTQISDRWQLRAGYEYNFVDDEEIESSAGISYKTQCWAMDVDLQSEDGDNAVMIVFNLAGLGAFGGQAY
jgi:LPS-assembly protein